MNKSIVVIPCLLAIGSALAPARAQNYDVVVSFGKAVTSAELEEITNRSPAFVPSELHYYLEGMRGGYTLRSGEQLTEAMERMNERHEAFLERVIEINERRLATESDEKARLGLEVLKVKLQHAREHYKNHGLQFSSIRMKNRPGLVAQLMKERGVVSATPAFSRPNSQNTEKAPEEKSTSHEPWAPYRGESDVTKTYTYSDFYFNSLSGYPSDGTYEHETQVYNTNFADYDNYWSSNLPSAYYDTPFLDTLDNFTVGSAEATSLALYTQYYTYMALRGGSAATATVRIKGQRGNRTPSWCYSTWCIFADATTGSMATFTAPATVVTWTY